MLKILGFGADSIQCIVCEESKRIIDTLPLVIYRYIWFSHLCRLENYPQFLMLLFIGGLQYPVGHMVLLSLFLYKKDMLHFKPLKNVTFMFTILISVVFHDKTINQFLL